MPVNKNDLDFSVFDEAASSQEPNELVYDFSVFDNNVKKKEPSKILPNISQDGELESTTSTPQVEGEPKDLISRVYKRKKLKDEGLATGKVAVSGGTGGAGVSIMPNAEKIQQSNEEGKNILRDFSIKQSDLDDLEKELQDLPSEEERAKYKNPKGDQNLMYTNETLSTLREKDPYNYKKYLNTAKIYGSLSKVDKNLADEYIKINSQIKDFGDDVFENNRIRKDLKERQDELIAKSNKLTNEQKQKLIGYNNEIYSAIAAQGISDPQTAKDYLGKRLASSSAELDVVPTASNLYENKKLYEGEDIDTYPIESIEKFVDQSNPADVRALDVYKYNRAFNDAVKTSPNIEEAAIKYVSTIDPLIGQQREKLKEESRDLPEESRAEYVKAFLDDPRSKQLAQTDPNFRVLYTQEKNSFNIKYPKYAVKRISQIISQARIDRGDNNILLNIPTESGTRELVDDLVKEGKLSQTDKQIYYKELDPQIGVGKSLLRGTVGVPFGAFTGESPIKTPGVFENALTSFQNTTKDMARTVEDIPGLNPLAMTDAYRLESTLTNNARQLSLNLPKIYQLSEATGNLIGFTIPMIFGGEGLKALGTGEKAAHTINSGLMFAGHNRDNALKLFPDDPVKRLAFTTLSTAGDMFLMDLIPSKNIRKGISNVLKKDVAEVTEKLINKEITPQIAEKTLLEKTMSYLPKLAVENLKTAGTMTGFGMYHNALESMFGANDLSAADVILQGVNDFKQTYLTTPILSMLSLKGGEANRKVDSRILMEMAAAPEGYRNRILDFAQKNNEPKDVTEEKLRNLENASVILKDISKTDLTQSQKEKYFIYAVAEKALRDEATKTTDSTLKKKYLDEANSFSNVKEKILSGEDKAIEFNQYEPITENDQREINKESDNAVKRSMGEAEVRPEELKTEEGVQEGVERVRPGEAEREPAVLTGVEEKETVKQMKPITDEMVKVEREFENNGFKIDTDYDNEIIVTDKNGEIVEAEDLPDNLRKMAADYEAATSKLGEFSDTAREKALAESRGVTEVAAEEVKPEELPEGEKPAVYTADNLDQVSTEGLDKTQAKVVGDVKNVVKAVSNIVKETTGNKLSVSVHTSPSTYGKAVIEAGGTRQDASTKGFYLDKNGTIHLNMDKVTSETMLHEGFHPILDFMEVNNPKLVETIYDQLNSFSEGQRFIESNKRRYTGEVTQKKEAITDFIAHVADGSIVINPSNFAKIKKFIIDSLNKLGFDLKSFKTAEIKDASELVNLTKLISEKFKAGEEIKGEEILSDIKPDQKFQPVKNKGDVGDVSAAGTIDPAKIKNAKVMDKNPLQMSREEFKEVELSKLPIRSLQDALKPFNNKAIAINSDPTRVGKLKLISGDEIFMYGGLNYSSIKANVEGEIGFSSTALSKPKQVQNTINKLFPETNGEGLILVTSQSPESMKGNAYALEYVLDAVKQLPKSVLRTGDFKTEFFGKDIVAIKDAFGEQKYNEFVKKYGRADFTNDAVMKSMVSDLLDGVGSNFVARNSLVSNLLAGVVAKSTRAATKGEPGYVSVTPNKYIAKQLFDRFGLNQEKLFYEIGEKGIVDVYMDKGEWGFITSGFTSDSKVDYMSIQNKGVVHPQFNAKFHGKDPFILDGGYQIDKLFLPEEITSQTGKPYTKKASLMVAGSMYPKGEVVPTAEKTAERIPQFSREENEKEDIVTASVNVAPLYSTKVGSAGQAITVHESELYKKYKQRNEDVAKMFNLEVVSQEDGVGGYEFSNGEAVMEATTVINVKGKFSDIVEYAAMNGALTPEVQDATIAGMYVKKGSEFHNADKVEVKIDNVDAAMKAAKDAGFDKAGFTLVDGEISFFNVFYEKDPKKQANITKQFEDNLVTFVNKYEEYGGKVIDKNTSAVRSEYIDNVRRREILDGIESKAISGGQDRAGFRDALATAKERNTRYTTWKYLDKSETAKQYRSLRQKQFDLAADGKSLSDAERNRMSELEKRMAKLLTTTFKTESELSAYDQAKSEVDQIASDVAKLVEDGYKSEFPTKRPSRAAIKTVRWYSSQPNLLGDGARTNVIVNTDADANFLFNELTKRFPSAKGRIEATTTELGYPKRLMEIRTSNGKLAEIQVMTPQGYLAKDGIKDFPKDAQEKAQKSLDETRERLGWDIPDGVGHYFYEINRDVNVPKKLRDQAAEISRKYYDAFTNPESKLTDAEFREDVSDFKSKVDEADKTKWDEGNNGTSPETLNKYLEEGKKIQFSREEEGKEEPKRVGLSKAEIAKQVEEFSMLPPERMEKVTDAELDDLADAAISSGYDVQKLVDRLRSYKGNFFYDPTSKQFEKGELAPANPLEVTILNKYAAALNADLEKNISQETLKKYTEVMDAARKSYSLVGSTLRQAKRSQALVDNLANFLVDKEVAQGAPLTENQLKVEEQKYNELKKEKEDLAKQLEIEKEKNIKLAAELEKKNSSKKTGRVRTESEYKSERKSLLESAKEALLKLKEKAKGEKGGSEQYSREEQLRRDPTTNLMAIAPMVKDMMKVHLDQKIEKLDDIVNAIHSDLKELEELTGGVSKAQIIEIIAGRHDAPPVSTRNELASKIRLMKREADLLLQLADARKGLESAKREKSDKKEIQSNKRIKELETQLAEVKRISKESQEMDQEVGELTNDERLAKKQKLLLKRIERLKDAIDNKEYLEPQRELPPIKLDEKTKALIDRVTTLENKIKDERIKDILSRDSKAMALYRKTMHLLGIKRIVQTSFDLSVSFRQGATMLQPTTIKQWGKSFWAQLLSAKSQSNYNELMFKIRNSKDYHEMVEDGIVFNDLETPNEDFANATFIQKIPGIKASQRAADGFLNTARYELYMKFKDNLERQGITRQSDPKAYKDAAKWAMNMTGRGNLIKSFEHSDAQTLLGNTFFGARLMASRFNMLNPITYANMHPEMRKQAVKDIASWVGTTIGVGVALSQIPGVTVSLNPDDSDFLQVRYKKKVYDLSGGLGVYLRTFLRLTQSALSTFDSPGYVTKQKQERAGKSFISFFRNKLAPNTSYAVDAVFGSSRPGQDFNAYDILKVYPMYVDDVVNAWGDEGVTSLATVLLPNIIGIGYGAYAKKGELETDLDKLTERNRNASYMDYSNMKNWKKGGVSVTDDEFLKYAEKLDEETTKYINELYTNGKYIVDDNNNLVKKKYSELTPDQVNRAIQSYKERISNDIKDQMFGEPTGEKFVSEKVKQRKQSQLRKLEKGDVKILNYNKEDKGVPITNEEYIEYVDEVDRLFSKYIDKLKKEGVDVVSDDNEIVHKDFREMTNDELESEMSSYIKYVDDKVKTKMFGEQPYSEIIDKKIHSMYEKQLNMMKKIERMSED